MPQIILSLIGLLFGTALMVIGNQITQKTKYWKQGGILVKCGMMIFFIVISIWAAYGKRYL